MKTKCCNKKFIILINLLFIFAILTFSFFTLKVFAGSAASIERIKSGGVSSIGKTADIAFGNEHGAAALGSGRKDLYCIRKGHFMGDKTWTVRGYVQIVGNNATSWDRWKNKRTSLHNINGEVAYILDKEQGYGSAKKVEDGHQDKYSAGQMALYTKIDLFCEKNGLIGFTGGNPSTISGFATTDYEPGVNKEATDLITDAEYYATNLGNTDSNVKVNNLTQINNIKFDSYLWSDNKTYTRIGPFRLSFSGTMKDVYITDQNNNKISPIWIEKYVGNSLEYIGPSQIESNKDFYITIYNDGKINKINKIGGNLDVPGNIKSAEVWILEHTEKQNLLLAKPSNKPLTGSFNIDLYIKLFGNIAIEKIDKDNNNIKLKSVKFIVRNVATGEYITGYDKGSQTATTHGSKSNAYEFVTDQNGKIVIKNVYVGEYEFIEIDNPNYGYRVEEAPLYKVSTTDGITYYTAINEQFIGNIAIEKVDLENHDKKLANVSFIVRYVDTGEYISDVMSDKVLYTSDSGNAKVFVTDDQGKILIENVLDGDYEFIETENPNYGYRVEETPLYKVSTTDGITYYTAENEQFIGDIGLEKVDADNHENKLKGVQFIVRYVDTDEYVSEVLPEIKEARYTKNKEEAMIFTTDEEGKIIVQNLLDGEYEFIEVAIPQYGYVVSEEPIKTTTADEVVYVMMENKQLYIKISGDVWLDIGDGKETLRDYRYTENSKDKLLSGIKVVLKTKDANGNYVLVESQYEDETGIHDLNPIVTTDENGHYVFEGVEIEKLGDYYIDFEYDGLLYQSVPDGYAIIDGKPEKIKYTELETAVVNKTANGKTETLDFKNTSKAVEWHWDQKGAEYEAVRDQFNNKFGEISNNSPNSVKVTNYGKELFYKVPGENGYGAEFERNNKKNFCEIIASTNYFGSFLDIPGSIGNSVEEITHINLGIYERAQADLAIMKDLEQVKVGIKGYDHIYKYASRFDNEGKPKDGSWDVGVKFADTTKYDVEVYESDYKYTGSDELNMTMTYRIVLRNESTINTRVNSIVDEFTGLNGFGKVTVGTEFDEKSDKVTGLLQVQNNGRNGSQMVIDTSRLDLDPVNSPTRDIYIQVQLSRSDVENLIGKGIIENKVEINSYTSYDENGKLYAAVDIDSVPGNMNSNLEDDNDKAPDVAIILPKDGERTVSGIVFEDGHIENMLTNYNVREGNGKYDNGESKVSGVKVDLLENDVIKLSCTTNASGEYQLVGFEPGEYKIRFTWGNGIQKTFGSSENYHDVTTNYKGTVFDKNRYEKENSNSRFYQEGFSEDLTHAIDDWNTRIKIDTQLNSHPGGENNGYNYATSVSEDKMLSDTCMMKFPVEIEDETDTGVITEFDTPLKKYLVDKMSFGIAERAKQSLEFDKWVSNVKVTLPDGRVLADAIITKDGNISGLTDYVAYMPDNQNINGIRSNGWVKIEMDAELMQTSDLEIVYSYYISNISEADFANVNYYNHGYKFINNSEKDRDIVKITPSKIVDYLDSQNIFRIDHAKNLDAGWKLNSLNQLKTIVSDDALNGIDKKLFNCYLTEKSEPIAPKYKSATENPAGKTTFELVAGKTLAIDSNIDYINRVEIVEINKSFGSKIECIPGNYEPNSGMYEIDTAISERVKVMKSTGGNGNKVILFTALGVGLLGTFGIGLYLIKKKVI